MAAKPTKAKSGKARQIAALAKARATRAGIEWEMIVEDVRYYASLGPEWAFTKEKPQRLAEMETVTLYGRLVRPDPPTRDRMEFRIFASDMDLSKTKGDTRIGHVQQQRDCVSAAVWVGCAQFGRIVAAACSGKVEWAKAHSDVFDGGMGNVRSFAVSTDLPEDLEEATGSAS
jgi:hypothetical protein